MKDREKHLKQRRAHYAATKEAQNERDRQRYAENKETRLAWQHEYYAAHKGERAEYGRRTADVAKGRRRRWYHKNIIRSMLGAAKARAKKKGLLFAITEADVFIPHLCPLLLIPLAATGGARAPGSPSLDRKDSTKGYIPGNVWVISYRANRIKNDATLTEFTLMAHNLRLLLGDVP